MALQKLELPPAGKRLTIYDTKISKLALRVTSAGSKTFYVVKRAGTEIAWVKLGAFPEMTVEKAQAEAERILGEFASGANPAEARRAFKAEPTLTEYFAEYGTRHGEKKLSWRDDQQRFRDYLQKPLGDKKLTTITRADGQSRFWRREDRQGGGDGAPDPGAGIGAIRQGDRVGLSRHQPGARCQGSRASRDP